MANRGTAKTADEAEGAPVVDLSDFVPTPTQDAFLFDRTRVRALLGGLGSGKTRTGAEAFLDAVMDNPGCEAMFVSPTFPMLSRLTMRAWRAACPKEFVVAENKEERWIRLVGNRTVWYGTAENPQSLEGSNLAAFWLDEARYMKRQAWQNMLARLRVKSARRLQAIITSTPDFGWLDEEFNRGLDDRRPFKISTRENAVNLADGYIENLERSYSPRLCKSLIEGDFTVVEGQVWEAFDKAKHLVDWTPSADHELQLWCDFGVRKSSWIFVNRTGTFPIPAGARKVPGGSRVIFDELQLEQLTTERAIPELKRAFKAHGFLDDDGRVSCLDAIYCDPAGRNRDISEGLTSVALLEAAFGKFNRNGERLVRYETAARTTAVSYGIGRVESALDPLKGEPSLYVDARLAKRTGRDGHNDFSRGVVKTLQGLKYDEKKNGTGRSSDKYAKDAHFEHCADTLRYGVVNDELAHQDFDRRGVRLRRGG